MMQTGIHIDSGYFLTEFADFLRNMFQFLFWKLREPFQLIHEHSKCFFLLHFNQLCVEVYDNTCDDRNDKNSVNREQDGTDLSNQCDGNNVSKSGGRDDGVTIPQRITIAVDIRFDKPDNGGIGQEEEDKT